MFEGIKKATDDVHLWPNKLVQLRKGMTFLSAVRCTHAKRIKVLDIYFHDFHLGVPP